MQTLAPDNAYVAVWGTYTINVMGVPGSWICQGVSDDGDTPVVNAPTAEEAVTKVMKAVPNAAAWIDGAYRNVADFLEFKRTERFAGVR